MLIKKCNAILSIVTSVVALYHCSIHTIWMLSQGKITPFWEPTPYLLAVLATIHAVISIVMVIRNRGAHIYVKPNASTLVQRFSGVAMLLLLPLHIMGSVTHFSDQILHAIVHPLFFGVILIHVAVSVKRALITLGIGSVKALNVVQIILSIVCSLLFVASTIGLFLCLFGGIG